jgi:hypothetical protein
LKVNTLPQYQKHDFFKFDRKTSQLAVLQRIELLSPSLKKIRKFLGRYIFTKFISRYLINPQKVSIDYYHLMSKEILTVSAFLKEKNNILSIGSGIGGLELLILKKYQNTMVHFIEKNYISKKVRYGWDKSNFEAYNSLNSLNFFLLSNGIDKNKFKIFDCDKSKYPNQKFDLIISLYSLDYHYDYNIYKEYLKKVSTKETIFIFDTIRSDYFTKIFKNVSILKDDNQTVHKSKRIACKIFIDE